MNFIKRQGDRIGSPAFAYLRLACGGQLLFRLFLFPTGKKEKGGGDFPRRLDFMNRAVREVNYFSRDRTFWGRLFA